MSGYIGIRQDHSISLFTDTAGFSGKDSKIAEFSPKHFLLKHDAVIVCRGSTIFTDPVIRLAKDVFETMSDFSSSLEAFLDICTAEVKAGHAKVYAAMSAAARNIGNFDVLVAGMDGAAPTLAHFCSDGFVVTRPRFIINGLAAADAHADAAQAAGISDHQGIAMMDMLRGVHDAFGVGIGGQIDRVDICRTGIEVRRIHDFGDTIGERITNVTPLSREVQALVDSVAA